MKRNYESPMLELQAVASDVVTTSAEKYDNVMSGLWGSWFGE